MRKPHEGISSHLMPATLGRLKSMTPGEVLLWVPTDRSPPIEVTFIKVTDRRVRVRIGARGGSIPIKSVQLSRLFIPREAEGESLT